MIVKADKKQTFGIIGLPRSGTTLLANIFNSIDNSICLSEPIRAMHSTKERSKNKNMTESFLNGTKKYINLNPNHQIFGIKETYSHIPSRINKEIHKLFSDRDFLIFIIRDPKSCFSGWKQIKMIPKDKNKSNFDSSNYIYKPRYKFGVEHYIQCYKSLINEYHEIKMNKPTFLIRYEELCNNFNSDYLNNIFKGYLKFEGEIDKLNDAIISLGDHMAIGSKEIREPRITCDNLKDEDIDKINSELVDIYKNTRGYGYY